MRRTAGIKERKNVMIDFGTSGLIRRQILQEAMDHEGKDTETLTPSAEEIPTSAELSGWIVTTE